MNHFLRYCRLPALAVVSLLAAAAGRAVTHNLTYDALQDTWVQSGVGANGTAPTLQVAGGGSPKQAFLRFRINMSGLTGSSFAGRAITGTPNQVILRLRQTSTEASGQSILVMAANNRATLGTPMWIESMVWADKPAYTGFGPPTYQGPLLTDGAIITASSGTAPNYVDFDVTDYISGPGDYTFCVRTNSTNQVDFGSKESVTPPQLLVTIKDDATFAHNANRNPYYIRYASEVKRRGDRYRARAEEIATGEVNNIGIIKVTQQPYGARTFAAQPPTADSTENTLALQRAIAEARDMQLTTYFPGGTYYVNDTLQVVQGEVVHGDPKISFPYEYLDGLRTTVRDFPCVLVGDPAAQAVLKIPTGAGQFNSQPFPRPLVYFWSRQNSETGGTGSVPTPELNEDNSHYHAGFHNIDIDATNNVDAIAFSMASAQGCTVSNVDITGTNYYAGLDGAPGPGGYTYGLTVAGGQFGGLFQDGHAQLLINCKFTGQAQRAIVWEDRGALTLVGVEIQGRGIQLASSGGGPWLGNLNLIDSRVEITASNHPAITGNRSVFVKNSYLRNASGALIALTDDNGPGIPNEPVSTAWKYFPEWAAGVSLEQSPSWGGAEVGRMGIWNAGARIAANTHPFIPIAPTGGTPPANFSQGTGNFHAWSATFANLRYVQNDTTVGATTVINAKTTSVGTLGGILHTATNNAARLNSIIASAPANSVVFIPAGEFPIEDTISLINNVTLYGVSSGHSILRAVPGLGAKAMTSTPNSGTAAPKLADLMLLLPNNTNGGAYLTNWQAGQNSAVKNVIFDRHLATAGNVDSTVPAIQISNNGAGRWYGLWNESGANQAAASYRHVRVLDKSATQALRIYMLNVEHAATSPGAQAEFDNADNVRIYQLKAESGTSGNAETVSMVDCDNFRLFGTAGSSSPNVGKANIRILTGNTNYLISQVQFQQQGVNTGNDPFDFDRLFDGVAKVPGEEQAVLYKRGNTTTTAN